MNDGASFRKSLAHVLAAADRHAPGVEALEIVRPKRRSERRQHSLHRA
jgi:hypothetical protein